MSLKFRLILDKTVTTFTRNLDQEFRSEQFLLLCCCLKQHSAETDRWRS